MRLIAVLFLCGASLAAQVAPQRVGVAAERRLTLAEALELALNNNLEIEIEKTNTATSAEAVRAARGFLDPNFRWLPSLETHNLPTGSLLAAAKGKLSEHFHSQNFYFRQRTPWAGSQFGVDFENGRQSTNSPFASLSPFVTSRLAFHFTQPLLRNRVIDRERAELTIRRKQRDVSEVDLKLRAIDVVTRVEQAYWDVVAARQDANVKSDLVEWAREQLARNKRMIDAGSLAPVELSASEAELERRLDTWYAALGAVTEAENALKTLIAASRDAAIWNDAIIPVDQKIVNAPSEIYNVQESVVQALDLRPELRVNTLNVEANDVETKHNANQTRPQVNLVASYSSAGIGGTTRPVPPILPVGFGGIPETSIGGYGNALSNLFSGRYQSVQVGLAFDWTPRNNTAEANLAQSVIAERRLKLQRAQIEQAIAAQVRNSLQALQTARQRIAAAQASARAAKEKLDSEVRLFQTGESTNFLVLTRQNELADSRRREVVANLDFNKAISRLAQAVGTTLRDHNIDVKP